MAVTFEVSAIRTSFSQKGDNMQNPFKKQQNVKSENIESSWTNKNTQVREGYQRYVGKKNVFSFFQC